MSAIKVQTDDRAWRFNFVFVCQAGELELKAALLAASLRRYLRVEHELIAAVPGPVSTWGELAPQTRKILQRLDVHIRPLVNPVGPEYGIGNKLACLELAGICERSVFLDSDILLLREFFEDPCPSASFAAKPADFQTFPVPIADWHALYAAAGAKMPATRIPATVSGEFGPPYFNSGVVFVAGARQFGAAWTDCARRLESESAMKGRSHWLDQVSLAVTVHRLGLDYFCLDESYNFPAHVKRLPKMLPYFCHYHWPGILLREPALHESVRDLCAEHNGIAELMQRYPHWSSLLDQETPARSLKRRESSGTYEKEPEPLILITGIPCSGSSDLLRILARSDAGTTLDEPESVSTLLMTTAGVPWEFAVYLQGARNDAESTSSGEAKTIDDEHGAKARGSGRFLAMKCDLALLCRLQEIRRVCQDVRIVVCIDDPPSTIAAWIACGESLRLDQAMASVSAAPWLRRRDADELQRIVSLDDSAEKLAAYWWWLAQRVLENSADVTIIRRDRLLRDPQMELEEVVADVADLSASRVAGHSDFDAPANIDPMATLNERDRQAIRAICTQAAHELGLACNI